MLNKPDLNKRFLYTALGNIEKVLFLISNEEIENLEDSSKEKLISIIQNIRKNNISLVLKGHPRLGEPEEIKKYADFKKYILMCRYSFYQRHKNRFICL